METYLQVNREQVQARIPLTIFRLEGEIDVSTYSVLQDAAGDANRDGSQWLLLDMSGVRYMDSAGLRALHHIDSQYRRSGSERGLNTGATSLMDTGFKSPYVKLLHPSDAVARTLKVSGFEMIFEIFHDRQAAIDGF